MSRPVSETRHKVRILLAAGRTQAQIARELNLYPSAIAHHARALGVQARKYRKPLPMDRGKRQCAKCHARKKPGQFPSGRNAVCTVCTRSKISHLFTTY